MILIPKPSDLCSRNL